MPRLVEGICPQFTQLVFQKCKAAGIRTVTDFILKDPEDLAKKIKTPYKDVLSMHRALIVKHSGFPQNALSLRSDLLESISILDTGSKSLNKFLSGGIYTGEVTEINGSPGSGKTQFCLSLVCNLILQTKSTVLYLDTSSNFAGKRIEQILLQKNNEFQDIMNKLQNVKVKYIYDIYDLFDFLDILKTELYKQDNIFSRYMKLLVIDSITPLLSPCFGGKYLDGLGLMNNVAQQLQVLCCEHKLSVLICNNTVQDKDGTVKPALGLHWKYIPSVSLNIDKKSGSSLHKMKALKSCRCDLFEDVTFKITEAGITD